jgi:hypothetical protein
MKKSLFDQINKAIDNRGDWAERQQANYTMRNGGIRRRSLPYPGAPDGHYPLGDTMVEKLKPPYIQQLYASENICAFVCLKPQDDTLTQGISAWFDYQLKQKSNFERTMFVGVDQMLEQGFTPIKVYWDARAKRLAWDQVDPLHLIVPSSTQEYNASGGADWLVHVLHLSVDEYRANENFEQDEDFIKRIKGKGNQEADAKKQTVDLKEGINCSADENEIVLWEVYKRNRKDRKIEIETISPLLGCDDEENVVRPSFGMPYNRGCFASGEHFPFFKLRAEIKGKGHYSSRGLIEVNAPFEMSLTKTWNTIHEHQDFSSKPLFENAGTSPIPNAGNWKSKPGAILPPGLKLAQMPNPPSGLREDMELTRSLAEDRSMVPNFSASDHLTGTVPKSQTATGQQLIAAQSTQGNDLRSRVLKLDMADGLLIGYSILLQYGNADEALVYLVDGKRESLDVSALHDDYEIVPNGSADSWNKPAMLQKRLAYYQTFRENEFIDQAELTKWLLEAEDPRLVKRLFRDPQVATKDQEQQQMLECLEMMEGFVPDVHQSDDDKTHLMVMDQFSIKKLQAGQVTPELAQALIQHGTQHMGALKEKKDPMLRQIEAKLKPTAEALAMIAGQGQQNVIPMMQQPAGSPQGATPIDSPLGPTGPAGAATQELQPQMAGTP